MAEAPFFTILDTVDSTNNYAMARAHEGLAKHGMAWFTHEQTAGKGQRGKTWAMEKGKNIAMSVVLEPGRLKMTGQFHLSALVALSCFEFFAGYAGNETTIKWPNDLFWRDRKAGGILIENRLSGKNWAWAVVGIGININQVVFDEALTNPVSLKQITGKTWDVVELAKALHALLMKNLAAEKPMDDIMKAYNTHLYRINTTAILKKGEEQFETFIKEVSPDGKLVTIDARERSFDFGEVQWVL